MGHNWKLVLSGAGQIIGSPIHDIQAGTAARAKIDPVLRAEWFNRELPFRWIGIMIRYDVEENFAPLYEPIEPSDGELPLVIYMKMSDVCDPDPKVVEALMMNAVLTALIHVAKKYKLPDETLRRRRDELAGGHRLQ